MDKMITTGFGFEGYRITEYYGIFTAESVMAPSLHKQEDKLDDIREQTYEKLKNKLPKDANAIIGVQISHNHFFGTTPGTAYYFLTGTAVHIEKL